jgi:glucose-6-phosphate 1-epimerase
MFLLTYTVILTETGCLTTKLEIHNTQQTDFTCQALLHSYLRVADISTTTVAGLAKRKYTCKLTKSSGVENRTFANIDQEVDRVMMATPYPASMYEWYCILCG